MPIASLLLMAAVLGQDRDLPATDDHSAAFSRRYLAAIKANPRTALLKYRIPTAFYYGKAKLLMNYPQGPWEQAHLGVCRSMLEILDAPSGKEIKKIQEKYPRREIFEIKPEERVEFDERFTVLMGFEDPETSEKDKWMSSAGFCLGELGTRLTTWHYLGTTKEGQAEFHAALDKVAERAGKAPAGIDINLVKQMTLLGQMKRREKYSLEELRVVGSRIEAALITSLP